MTATDTDTALRSVDDALASGRASASDPIARELQELALTLAADAPEPDPAFAARLDARVAARFGQSSRRRPWPQLARPRLALVGAAATVLIAIAAVGAVGGLFDGERNLTVNAEKHGAPSAGTAQPAVSAGPQPAVSAAPQPASAAPQPAAPAAAEALRLMPPLAQTTSARRVERSTQLTLAAPDGHLQEIGDRIVQVADRHRGYVVTAQLSSGDGSSHSGDYDLRVPTTQLRAALAELSKLAHVRSRTDSSRDVTGAYNGAGDRLTAATIERRGLLRRLAHTSTTTEADRLRSRLDRLGAEIARLRDGLARLKRRTSYTDVAVTLVGEHSHAAPGALGDAGRALRGSLRALVGATAIALRVTAALLPFALLALLGWLAAGGVRRRRREAVLS